MSEVNTDAIRELIAALSDENGLVRQKARLDLVRLSENAVGPLIEAMASPNGHVRWEAAKALGQIGDPAAVPILVRALEDETFGVRWLAAEGLVNMGMANLKPLLKALETDSESVWLREGAHHVLRLLADKGEYEQVAPLLAALGGIEPVIEVPLVARALLNTMEEGGEAHHG